jgi:esterase/lipase superfamily enzyme
MIFKKIILGLICYILFACAKTSINNSAPSLNTIETSQKLQSTIVAKKPLTTAQLQQNLQPTLSSVLVNKFDNPAKIEVFVITNRQQKTNNFGCSNADFGNDLHNQTKYGSCIVLASGRRVVGEIVANENTLNTSLKVLQSNTLDKQQFFAKLQENKNNALATPLIYVHGFNTKYEEAVLRASQLAYDLKYQGPVIVFNWPAGSVGDGFDEVMLKKTYQINKINAIGSINPFIEFLQEMQKQGIKANFMVHSMGHQIVLTALHQVGQQLSPSNLQNNNETSNSKQIIQELFLLAPDYDANLFQQNLTIIKPLANRITLYCSQNDKALSASKITNNNHRLGECIKINDPNLDVINVTNIDNSLIGLGHSYFKHKPVLTDIYLALLGFEANHRLFINKASSLEPEKFTIRP